MSGTLQRKDIGRSLQAPGGVPVEWNVLDGLTGYDDALAMMDARVAAIAAVTKLRNKCCCSNIRRFTPPERRREPSANGLLRFPAA